jgi:CspA family cold shock protein
MPTGTVKWFDATKGFGFITPEEGDKDVFVHKSGVVGDADLNEGDRVSYETEDSDRGPRAVKVTPA